MEETLWQERDKTYNIYNIYIKIKLFKKRINKYRNVDRLRYVSREYEGVLDN